VAFQVDEGTATQGQCLDCLLNAGQALDNPTLGITGFDCEDAFSGVGAGETAAECLAVLACDFGVTPSAVPSPISPTGAGPVQGYCGTVAAVTCSNSTTPTGACATQIAGGFPSTFTASQVVGNIAVQAYASGRAGQIVSVAQQSCNQCLAGSTL